MYKKFCIDIRMVRDKKLNYPNFNDPRKVYQAYRTLSQKDAEEFHVIYLDAKNNVIGARMISRGSLTGAPVHPREVFKLAIIKNAASIICVHNHPSGNPDPSYDDIQVTEKLILAGKILRINVLDHIIIGDNCFHDMRMKGTVDFITRDFDIASK